MLVLRPSVSTTTFRRQLFANAAIAASRVGSWPCVGVRSSRWPKVSVHIHGVPNGRGVQLYDPPDDYALHSAQRV